MEQTEQGGEGDGFNRKVASESNDRPSAEKLYWEEAWKRFREDDYTKEKSEIVTTSESAGFMSKLFSCFQASLSKPHLDEKEIVYSIAKRAYNLENHNHLTLIQTLYFQLTGVENCPAFGYHWKRVGFQGDDPSRDFRSTGILGPLQVSAFIHYHQSWSKLIFEFTQDTKFGYPFMVSMFGFTRLALEVFRTAKLNSYATTQQTFISSFNHFFFASCLFFYAQYKKQGAVVADFGVVLNEVEPILKNKCQQLVKKYSEVKLLDLSQASDAILLI